MKKIIFLLIALLILPNQIFARDDVVEYQEPKYSPWAFDYILEGQVAGLIDLSKQSEGTDYTKESSESQIIDIEDQFLVKLKSKDLYKDEMNVDLDFPERIDRDHMLKRIYNILKIYNKNQEDYINFLRQGKILEGKLGGDLGLEDKVSYEEVIAFYTRALEYIYREENLGGRGIFYRVENGASRLYILGSIHSGDYFMYPLEEKRTQAFEESDELYVELNLTDLDILEEIINSQQRFDGSSLREELGNDLYERTLKVFNSYGVKEEQIEDLKSFVVLSSLTSLPISEYNPSSGSMGIDSYFMNKANHKSMDIKSLETVKIQVDAMEEIYEKDHKKLRDDFEKVIEIFEKGEEAKFVKDSQALKRAWQKGNQNKILELITESGEIQALSNNRNIKISEKIIELLDKGEDKVYFLIVGAGHLIGENSLIDYLEEGGFELVRIP